MKNVKSLLVDRFAFALQSLFPHLSHPPIEIVRSTQDKFGHYQFNSAMKLAKDLRQPPRNIAAQIVEKLEIGDIAEKVDIEGPGFINITLSSRYLEDFLQKMLNDHLGIESPFQPQKVVIDFSSPNTAKEMHVGHLRSTIIGDCLARVFEFLGHRVLRLNHIGDWGTSFGMLIAYLKQVEPKVLDGTKKAKLEDLVLWYKEAKKKFDQDPSFKKEGQQMVVELQKGVPESLQAWHIICEISSKAYQEIYDLLDISIIDRGESFYNNVLPDVVADLESKGLVTISDGAKCIFLEGFKNRDGSVLPLMIQKSDGGYNYDTTDMAAIRQRIFDEKADRIIYVTDQGQSTHFQMIFKAAELAHYLNPSEVRVDHVGFGLVLGPDGKKFRTRSGETERLVDLLQAGIDEAKKILIKRNPNMDEKELKEASKILGLGAIKYADLSSHRMSDYAFSYEKMLRFEGNTAAFIMYSYVRVGGIKRKIGESVKQGKIYLEQPAEVALAFQISLFEETLEQLTDDLLPHRLTDYLYILAEKFNAFFRDCRVEGTKEQASRLLLCELTAKILKTGLTLLGIRTMERM